MVYIDGGLLKTAMELLDQDLIPRVRLYRVSRDGLRMRVLAEVSVEALQHIEGYALDLFGTGRYCAKLFSTKYGRNILECRHDFIVGNPDDIEDGDF